jgi:hypothetical protein
MIAGPGNLLILRCWKRPQGEKVGMEAWLQSSGWHTVGFVQVGLPEIPQQEELEAVVL